jgi:hypothetical protein
MRLAVLLPIVYSLFATFSFAADPSLSAAIPDHVAAAALIHEMNLTRQNPALYERSSNKGAGIIPVGFVCCQATFACTRTKAFARSMTRYDFCFARSRNNHSRFRPVFVWLRLIIVASRLTVQRDITATMAAIPGIESVATAW